MFHPNHPIQGGEAVWLSRNTALLPWGTTSALLLASGTVDLVPLIQPLGGSVSFFFSF